MAKRAKKAKKSKDCTAFVSFQDYLKATDWVIQNTMKEVEPGDLVLALSGLSARIQKRFLDNMSAAAGKIIRQELKSLGKVRPSDQKKARKQMLDITNQLPAQGPKRQKSAAAIISKLTRALDANPASRLGAAGLADAFAQIAEIARREGILAIEKLLPHIDDPFLCQALKLVIDGTCPELIEDYMAARRKALIQDCERRLDVIRTGITSIQSGTHPFIVQMKCEALLPGGD